MQAQALTNLLLALQQTSAVPAAEERPGAFCKRGCYSTLREQTSSLSFSFSPPVCFITFFQIITSLKIRYAKQGKAGLLLGLG